MDPGQRVKQNRDGEKNQLDFVTVGNVDAQVKVISKSEGEV
jgi:hypothetical protein